MADELGSGRVSLVKQTLDGTEETIVVPADVIAINMACKVDAFVVFYETGDDANGWPMAIDDKENIDIRNLSGRQFYVKGASSNSVLHLRYFKSNLS